MTDERLCSNVLGGLVCGRPESHEIHHPRNATRLGHPFEEAPSTDEGDEQWAREIADRWVNSATAEDRETVVLTECEKHPGVMPEWACPTCVRASLEAEVERLREALMDTLTVIDHANRGAFENGVTDSTGSTDEGEVRAWDIANRARQLLATPPSSTEGTDTLKANFDGCPFCGGDESIGVHAVGRCAGT